MHRKVKIVKNLIITYIILETNNNKEEYSSNENDIPPINTCYKEKGIFKISNDIIVPDYLVSLVIGSNSQNIKAISSKTGCSINFAKEV